MVGDSSLASPTTETRETTSRPTLSQVSFADGGSAKPSPSSSRMPVIRPYWSLVTGRKNERCWTVWVNTNPTYSESEATAANASWDVENCSPSPDVVKLG